jgi:uncharacterized protein (DUF4415 family)
MTAKRKTIPAPLDELPPLTDAEGEVRELTAEDFKHFRPISEFPELVAAIEAAREEMRARGQRGPQKTPTKERITLRLDRDIVESYRAGGPGWQTRINDDLAKLQKRKKHG